ncbi:MAG: PepSY domain-containing protein [Burkholderiaceae bacterium]|nr:PepSY domain-containing protein [Burkholderiaceae bacterium]
MSRTTTLSVALAVASIGLATAVGADFAHADDRIRRSEVRELREAGKILPMEDILSRTRSAQPGQVVEIELEREDGRLVYEVKLIDDADAIHKLELDAATGEVLRRSRK